MKLTGLTGSIFEIDNSIAEGIAIFIPCGLTAIRVEASQFLSGLEKVEAIAGGIFIYNNIATAQTIAAFPNSRNTMLNVEQAGNIVCRVLSIMASRSVKSIAMNGIRFASQNHDSLQEHELVRWVMEWCLNMPNKFEKITFVGKRGGFRFLAEKEGCICPDSRED